MNKEELKKKLNEMRSQMKVTEICCSRVMSGSLGDKTFVSLKVTFEEGLEMDDSKIASALLGLETDQAALTNALAGGVIGDKQAHERRREIRGRYGMLIAEKSGLTNEEETDG